MSNIITFYQKHKVKIITLSPVVFGLLYFLLSSGIALQTINNSEMPTDFDQVASKIKNYNVYELDSKTSKLKWNLEADSASSVADKSIAFIKKVKLEVYDEGHLNLIMRSDTAEINRASNSIDFNDNVEMVDAKGEFLLNAGRLRFKDGEDFNVQSDWSLDSKDKLRIKGDEGTISKTFDSVVSRGNASISKDDLQLKADIITVNKEEPIIAEDNASLLIDANNTMSAKKIVFSPGENVKADGGVKVKADGMDVASEHLKVILNSENQPQQAYFTGGSPSVVQDGKKIYADIINYNFASKQVNIEGNIHTD